MPIPANTLLDEVEFDSDDKGASPGKKQATDSQSQFCKLDNVTLRTAEIYTMQWGSKEEDVVLWKILQDGEFLVLDENSFVMPDKTEYHLNLSDGMEAELNEPSDFFFKYIFPDITAMYVFCFLNANFYRIRANILFFLFSGHAKIIDKYLLDTRCTYHDTVKLDEIIFFLMKTFKIQTGMYANVTCY